jgi:hypothetical protein
MKPSVLVDTAMAPSTAVESYTVEDIVQKKTTTKKKKTKISFEEYEAITKLLLAI